MGRGRSTGSKAKKSSALEKTTFNSPATPGGENVSQSFYNNSATAPAANPGFYPSMVAQNPQGHPYLWTPQILPPYGTPAPYVAMYPQGSFYQHPSVQMNSGANVVETEKSSKKNRRPIKKSKKDSGALENKNSAGSSPNSENSHSSESGSSSEESSTDSESNTSTKDGPEHAADQKGKSARKSSTDTVQKSSGQMVLNPIIPYWPGPPGTISGQTPPLNMEYWGVSPAVPMHGKLPSSSNPVSTSVVPHDLSMQDEREMKRLKRKQSNREAARRSRLRKQAEWEEVANRATILMEENNLLKEQLKRAQEECEKLTSENESLHKMVKELQDEKKLKRDDTGI